MLARLLIGFLAVIVPSTALLGGVTLYSLTALARVNAQIAEITHSREAVGDLRLTLTQVGAPLGAYLLGGDIRNRQRFEGLIRSAEERLQSCAAEGCHYSTQTPSMMAEALKPAIERLKVEGRLIFEEGPGKPTRQPVGGTRGGMEPMLAAVRLRGEQLERDAEAVQHRAWLLAVLLMIGIALAGSAAAIFIARRISRPLSDLVSGTRRVMAGDRGSQASVAGPRGNGEPGSAVKTKGP